MEEQDKSRALIPAEEIAEPVTPAPRPNYYMGVVTGYRSVSRFVLFAIVLFTVLFFLFFPRAFTYERLYYFAKDVSSLSALAKEERATVTYAYHEGESSVVLYRGGLARVSTAGVEVFGADGTRNVCAELTFFAPRIAASRKYAIAYDHGGTDFYIYNSYAELYHGVAEGPILGAYPSDSGEFALVLASADALSSVAFYDSNFGMVQRFDRSYATVGAALSENGKKIALLGVRTESGRLVSCLDLYEIGMSEPIFTQTFEGIMPSDVLFLNSKNLVALFSDRAVTMNIEGKVSNTVFYQGKGLAAYTVSENGFALALSAPGAVDQTTVMILDKKGKEIVKTDVSSSVYHLAMKGKNVFALSTGELRRITFGGKETIYEVPADTTRIFAMNEVTVAAVRESETRYIRCTD